MFAAHDVELTQGEARLIGEQIRGSAGRSQPARLAVDTRWQRCSHQRPLGQCDG